MKSAIGFQQSTIFGLCIYHLVETTMDKLYLKISATNARWLRDKIKLIKYFFEMLYFANFESIIIIMFYKDNLINMIYMYSYQNDDL